MLLTSNLRLKTQHSSIIHAHSKWPVDAIGYLQPRKVDMLHSVVMSSRTEIHLYCYSIGIRLVLEVTNSALAEECSATPLHLPHVLARAKHMTLPNCILARNVGKC